MVAAITLVGAITLIATIGAVKEVASVATIGALIARLTWSGRLRFQRVEAGAVGGRRGVETVRNGAFDRQVVERGAHQRRPEVASVLRREERSKRFRVRKGAPGDRFVEIKAVR